MRNEQGNRGRRIPNRNRNDNRNRGHQFNGPRRNYQDDQPNRTFRKKFIKRDQDGKHRNPKGEKGRDKRKNEDRDLDRQMRDYWIGSKGGNAEEVKEVARMKLDSDLDQYWKNKKEDENEKAE